MPISSPASVILLAAAPPICQTHTTMRAREAVSFQEEDARVTKCAFSFTEQNDGDTKPLKTDWKLMQWRGGCQTVFLGIKDV